MFVRRGSLLFYGVLICALGCRILFVRWGFFELERPLL